MPDPIEQDREACPNPKCVKGKLYDVPGHSPEGGGAWRPCPDPFHTPAQPEPQREQERCTCDRNVEGAWHVAPCPYAPSYRPEHGPAQPVEQGEQRELWCCPVCPEVSVTGAPGLECRGTLLECRGTLRPHAAATMRSERFVSVSSLTTANQQIEEAERKRDAAIRILNDERAAAAGRLAAAETKVEELTRERDEWRDTANGRGLISRAEAVAQRDTLREAVSAAFSATYNPDISHLTSTKTVRNILQSVLSTPLAKPSE